jgi:hypothetical protein
MNFIERVYDAIKKGNYLIVFGAGNVAEEVVKMLKSEAFNIVPFCCAVTKMERNPQDCAGVPVTEARRLTDYAKKSMILIATVDKYKFEIMAELRSLGFINVEYLTFESKNLEDLRLEYIEKEFKTNKIKFSLLKNEYKRNSKTENNSSIKIFAMCNHNDKRALLPKIPGYMNSLQVGKYFTNANISSLNDNDGENISCKNRKYCELTGLYWIWKNLEKFPVDYIGICHYRRWFDITTDEVRILKSLKVDVVLTIPIINLPSVRKVYERDHLKDDWNIMMDVLEEFSPNYYKTAVNFFEGDFYYAYNMFITRKDILNEYCNWLFPLLEKIEERCSRCSSISRSNYQNRFVGFLGERLMALYFFKNFNKYRIVYVRKIFYD